MNKYLPLNYRVLVCLGALLQLLRVPGTIPSPSRPRNDRVQRRHLRAGPMLRGGVLVLPLPR